MLVGESSSLNCSIVVEPFGSVIVVCGPELVVVYFQVRLRPAASVWAMTRCSASYSVVSVWFAPSVSDVIWWDES